MQSNTHQYGRLVSYSQPCVGVSLSTFLRQAHGQERFYWESSRDSVAFAGFGIAIELMAWNADRFEVIRSQAENMFSGTVVLNETEPLAAPRLFGGFAFRDDFIPDNAWSDFTPAHFVLPHYQLVRINGESWLTVNTNIPFEENPEDMRKELHEALETRLSLLYQAEKEGYSQPPGKVVDLNYPMPYELWEQKVLGAVDKITQGDLKKVVLSRVAEARFDQRVDVDAAMDYLAIAYPETYRFLFEPRPNHAFYGATPELLVQVDGKTVNTTALAGSIRRGKTPEQDEALGTELLNSKKDRYEHQLVVDKIRDRLLPITDNLHIAETGLMKLGNIQHLNAPISGALKNSDGVLPVVKTLHPTPALGGDPREKAMQIIRESESVPRGWYGAPVGWIDRNMNGQFGVAIRSAVAQDRRVWMYAGAGIVKESEPRKEWDETALKFRPMLDALGITGDVDIS
jgi:menaquinone-specific isochorismate synthase